MIGSVCWFTGLPASGKTTLAEAVRQRLLSLHHAVCLLDSDEIRRVLVPSPGFSDSEREAFYSTLARLAGLLSHQRLIVLVAATAHRTEHRQRARTLAARYIEVYVRTPIEECERRDPKGLYDQARRGNLIALPGVQVEYEAPANPDVIAQNGRNGNTVDEILRLLVGDGALHPSS